MQKTVDDPLEIPAFLKVANRGKIKTRKTATAVVAAVEVDPVDELGVDPETAALLKAEIKTRRFQLRWLADPNTVFVFEREHQLRKAKKEAKSEDREVEKKIRRNERLTVKASLPEFGAGLKIIILIRDPKRQAGAARIPRFASLLEYLAVNPNASVAEIFKNTSYIKSDFIRDQRLKIIKTDLLPKILEPVKKIVDMKPPIGSEIPSDRIFTPDGAIMKTKLPKVKKATTKKGKK